MGSTRDLGVRHNILFKKRIERYVILKVQSQGLKSFYLKNVFVMWMSHYVAHGIVVSIFFIKIPYYWDNSFGVYLLKTIELMVWIFQEGCIWNETWSDKNVS
jgi:hypothetical protein